jgi:N-acetylmuramic acid 6-phosphate (MurNAc-6-P) etherase
VQLWWAYGGLMVDLSITGHNKSENNVKIVISNIELNKKCVKKKLLTSNHLKI